MLWTFYGERIGNSWHSVDLRITANTDFEELVRENLYPSDTAKELVHPTSNN